MGIKFDSCGRTGEWWAVVQDITSALGFATARDGAKKIPSKYKDRTKVPTLDGKQEFVTPS